MWRTFQFWRLGGATTAWCSSVSTQYGEAPRKGTYTADEVARRDGRKTQDVWVTFAGQVYDVTPFVTAHPGGAAYIRDAAGGPLEPYWGYWAYHTRSSKPADFLSRYHIGQLVLPDADAAGDLAGEEADQYSNEPYRGSDQIQLVDRPWSSETTPQALLPQFTPNTAFYVRNHAPTPVIDAHWHQVRISDADDDCVVDLETIKSKHKWVVIDSLLQCAGNRASEMMKIRPSAFKGTPFEHIGIGMMGNARWEGVRLADVLLDAFPTLHDMSDAGYHVEMEGADGYSASVPLARVLDPSYDAILAFKMNGEALPRDHGAPVRVLLPGIAGARSVKWVHAITIRSDESSSCWQQYYYKDPSGKAIQEMPLTSVILSKQDIGSGKVKLRGVAWGGGAGKGISTVQISFDEKQWIDATLSGQGILTPGRRRWSWVRWECEISGNSNRAATCRAFDGDGHCQPRRVHTPGGYCYNGWHQV